VNATDDNQTNDQRNHSGQDCDTNDQKQPRPAHVAVVVVLVVEVAVVDDRILCV
jgi:hypothetical protein